MLKRVEFRVLDYGKDVAALLDPGGEGLRPMSLTGSGDASGEARTAIGRLRARDLFPEGRCPEGALSGLYLYFGCLDEAHAIAQEIDTADGSFWHGIMHRREPDAGNAAYWFRRVGRHPIFPALRDEARRLRFDTGRDWDPFQFIEFCESARERPGSEEERIAREVQSMEWQLLFDWCARGKSR